MFPGFTMHDGKAITPNFAWGIYSSMTTRAVLM
jgi:hypothetical protein